MQINVLEGKRYYLETAEGNTFGYAVHAEETKRAMTRAGVHFCAEGEVPNVVFHQCPAHVVYKIEKRVNILYTAYEALDLPPNYIEGAKKMDAIFCTSDFTTKAFRRAVKKEVPVFTCSLGVDIETFSYIKRSNSSQFVFLWVGAPNERKGWKLIQEAWKRGGFVSRQDCLLYMKTTGNEHGSFVNLSENVVFDTRKMEKEHLADLYHAAHCFLYPSYGEGFGLTLSEAMATGLPCIFTPWGGVLDYADKKTGYPLKYKVVEINYGVKTTGAEADVDDMIIKMKEVMNNYHEAICRGKEASRIIQKDFTWENTGKKIKQLIKDTLKRRK